MKQVTENVFEWLNCDGKLELWGWRKLKLKRGSKAYRWRPRIATFYINNGYLGVKE